MSLTTERLSDDDFAALYRTHSARLRALVRRRVPDAASADDIVQETFLRVYRARERFDPARPAWPWLSRIAVNLCVDASRRRAARPTTVATDAVLRQLSNDADDASEEAETRERSRCVARAIEALPPRQRRLFVLRELFDMDYRELASREQITADAVKGHLKRARSAFRSHFAESAGGGWGFLLFLKSAARRARVRATELGRRIGVDTPHTGIPASLGLVVGVVATAGFLLSLPSGGSPGATGRLAQDVPVSARAATSEPGSGRNAALAGEATQSNAPRAPRTGAPVRARHATDASGPRLHEHDEVLVEIPTMAGPIGLSNDLDTSCDFNEVRQAACRLLDATVGHTAVR